VIVCGVDALPGWAAEHLRALVLDARVGLLRRSGDGGSATAALPFAVTAERYEDIPAPLAALVDTIVQVPPLRERPDDVEPLARHLAQRVRGREIDLTAAAGGALRSFSWPGNVEQLEGVVRQAATRTDQIDARHLPPEVLSGTTRRLTRIEAFERAEIVRVLTRPGITMREAADELGMSRATIYRKVAQYDLHLPRA